MSNEEWLSMFPGVELMNSIAPISNHNTILLAINILRQNSVKRRFIFKNSLLHEQFRLRHMRKVIDDSRPLKMRAPQLLKNLEKIINFILVNFLIYKSFVYYLDRKSVV